MYTLHTSSLNSCCKLSAFWYLCIEFCDSQNEFWSSLTVLLRQWHICTQFHNCDTVTVSLFHEILRCGELPKIALFCTVLRFVPALEWCNWKVQESENKDTGASGSYKNVKTCC